MTKMISNMLGTQFSTCVCIIAPLLAGIVVNVFVPRIPDYLLLLVQ